MALRVTSSLARTRRSHCTSSRSYALCTHTPLTSRAGPRRTGSGTHALTSNSRTHLETERARGACWTNVHTCCMHAARSYYTCAPGHVHVRRIHARTTRPPPAARPFSHCASTPAPTFCPLARRLSARTLTTRSPLQTAGAVTHRHRERAVQ